MMPTTRMIEAWLAHCKTVGHKTQAEALEAGENIEGRNDLATYSSGVTRIFCNAKRCTWQFTDPQARTDARE